MELALLEKEGVLILDSWKELPCNWLQREELDVEVLRVPATLDEFILLVDKLDYRIEYYKGEIYSFMGQASIPHETLVGMIIYYLNQYYLNDDDFRILGSNVKIFSEECEAVFNADISVVKGEIDRLVLKSGKKSIATLTNPYIIVEILSESTQDFDLGAKLACYKIIPSLQQILFIAQDSVYITSFMRTNDPNEWINHDYRNINETLKLVDFNLKIADIYRKMTNLEA